MLGLECVRRARRAELVRAAHNAKFRQLGRACAHGWRMSSLFNIPKYRLIVSVAVVLVAAVIVVVVASVHVGISSRSAVAAVRAPTATLDAHVEQSADGDLMMSFARRASSSGDSDSVHVATVEAGPRERHVLKLWSVARGERNLWSAAPTQAQWCQVSAVTLPRDVHPSHVAVAPNGRDLYLHAQRFILHYRLTPNGRLVERERMPTTAPSLLTDLKVTGAGIVLGAVDGTLRHVPLDANGAMRKPATISLPEGSFPHSITVPDEHTARYFYVLLGGTNNVARYEVARDESVKPSPTFVAKTGKVPLDMAFSPDGTAAYVVNAGDRTMSTYARDAETGALRPVGQRTPVGGTPFRVAALDSYVFVADRFDHRVAAYRVQSSGALRRDRASDRWSVVGAEKLIAVPAS
jgi:hypothetical protein